MPYGSSMPMSLGSAGWRRGPSHLRHPWITAARVGNGVALVCCLLCLLSSFFDLSLLCWPTVEARGWGGEWRHRWCVHSRGLPFVLGVPVWHLLALSAALRLASMGEADEVASADDAPLQ
jgi:hypothetical protein